MAGIFVKSHQRGKSVVKAYVKAGLTKILPKTVKLDKKVAENFRKIRLATAARQRAHRIQAVRRSVIGRNSY